MFETDNEPIQGVSPQKTGLLEIRPEVREEGKKIRIFVSVTPFLQQPNLTVRIVNQDNNECSRVTLVNLLSPKVVFTMHLRVEPLPGAYTIIAQLHYDEIGITDTRETRFSLPPEEIIDA
jgi:hypothetical protein